MSAINLLTDQYKVSETDRKAKEALKASKKVVMVIWASNPDFVANPAQRDPTKPIQAEVLAPFHSVLVKKLVLKDDGSVDMDKSTADSKDGWEPLETNVTLANIFNRWKARTTNTTFDFRVLK
jgi:hypothetical protein